MKKLILIWPITCLSILTFGQVNSDSLQRLNKISRQEKTDSLEQKFNHIAERIDSTELKLASVTTLPQLPDSLVPLQAFSVDWEHEICGRQ